MGSVGPFELAPAPDLERLMPLLPSLEKSEGRFQKKRPDRAITRDGHTQPERVQTSR
jgi:hypothetical protein